MSRSFDPRIQLVAVLATMTLSIAYRNWHAYSYLSLFLVIQLILVKAIAGQLVRMVWVIAGVAGFTLVLHLLFGTPHGQEILSVAGLQITEGQLVDGMLYCWRVCLLFTAAAWLLVILERDRLADVIEWASRPLRWAGLSVAGLMMSLRIALRTIPYLQTEHRRIMMAQKARGASFAGSPIKRVSRQAQIMVPLLAATIRRGDRLGDALEVRYWSSDCDHVPLKGFTTGSIDLVQLILTIGLVVVVVVTN